MPNDMTSIGMRTVVNIHTHPLSDPGSAKEIRHTFRLNVFVQDGESYVWNDADGEFNKITQTASETFEWRTSCI